MQTGILVRINNQSFSCATLNGNGMGLCTVVPPEDEDAEAEVEGGMFGGRVGGDLAGEDTGCGLSHITPHSVPGWPSVTTRIQPREENTHQIQVSQMFESIYKYFFFHHRSVQSWFFMTVQPCAPCPDSCLSPLSVDQFTH